MAVDWTSIDDMYSDTLVVTLTRGFTQDSTYALEAGLQVFRDQVNVVDAKTDYDTLAVVLDKRTTQLAIDEGAGFGNVYKVYSDAYVTKYGLTNWWEIEVDKVAVSNIGVTVNDAIQAKLDDGTLGSSSLESGLISVSANAVSAQGTQIYSEVMVTKSGQPYTGFTLVGNSDAISVYNDSVYALKDTLEIITAPVDSVTGNPTDVSGKHGCVLVDTEDGSMKSISLDTGSAIDITNGITPTYSYEPSTRVLSITYSGELSVPVTEIADATIQLRDATGINLVGLPATVTSVDATTTVIECVLNFTNEIVGDFHNTPQRVSIVFSATGAEDAVWYTLPQPTNGWIEYAIGVMLGNNAESLGLISSGFSQDYLGKVSAYFYNETVFGADVTVNTTLTDGTNTWANTKVGLRKVALDDTYTVPDVYEDTIVTATVAYEGVPMFSDVTTCTGQATITSVFKGSDDIGNIITYRADLSLATSDTASTNYGFKLVQDVDALSGDSLAVNANIVTATLNGTDIIADVTITKDSTTDGVWYVDFNGTALTANSSNSVELVIEDADNAAYHIVDTTANEMLTSLDTTDNSVVTTLRRYD